MEALLSTEELEVGKYYRGVEGYPAHARLVIQMLGHVKRVKPNYTAHIKMNTIKSKNPFSKSLNKWYVVDRDMWVEVSEEEIVALKIAN